MEAPQREYLSCADTAKVVRSIVAEQWPGVKFSVHSKTYSGGASITVRWTDGPTTKAVESKVKDLEGKGFDGMIDLAYHHEHYRLPDGSIHYGGTGGTTGSMGVVLADRRTLPPGAVPVYLMADYIFCERSYSREVMERVAAKVGKEWGREPVKINKDGGYEWDTEKVGQYRTMTDETLSELHQTDCYTKPAAKSSNHPTPCGTAEPPKVDAPALTNPDDPATSRQLWALHCITRRDTRGWTITKQEASDLIGKAKSGVDITLLVAKL